MKTFQMNIAHISQSHSQWRNNNNGHSYSFIWWRLLCVPVYKAFGCERLPFVHFSSPSVSKNRHLTEVHLASDPMNDTTHVIVSMCITQSHDFSPSPNSIDVFTIRLSFSRPSLPFHEGFLCRTFCGRSETKRITWTRTRWVQEVRAYENENLISTNFVISIKQEKL